MPRNNLKTHCHTPDFDTKNEKIVLISETLQNLEIGQLYLDKGLKQVASKYEGRNIDTKQKKKKNRNENTESFTYFIYLFIYLFQFFNQHQPHGKKIITN